MAPPRAGIGDVVIAVDGPGGSGKSTVARAVARRFGLRYLDTGAMYRAVTWAVLRAGVHPADGAAVLAVSRAVTLEPELDPDADGIRVDGRQVGQEIRGAAVTSAVSAVAAVPEVRRILVRQQQALLGAGGIVLEGRDTGSVVAPAADLKLYLTADPAVRAERRAVQAGEAAAAARVQADLQRRDTVDSSRAASPLAVAPDAVVLDTSELSEAEVVDRIAGLLRSRAETADGSASRQPPGDTEATGPPRPAPVTGPTPIPGSREAEAVPRDPWRAQPGPPYLPWLFLVLQRPARLLAQLVFRVSVQGREHLPRTGAVIVAGNHSGFLDGPLVAAFAPRPLRVLVKAELYRGVLGRALHRLGQIPVHRGRPDRAALRAGVRVLQEGGALGIFPEGTRGTGELDRVQDGVAHLLLRAPCPVVPVVCLGTREALPKGATVPRLRAPVRIVFGPPFTVEPPPNPHARRAVAGVGEQVRVRMAAHLASARAGAR